MTSTMPLNPGLYRVHRIFYIAIAAFAIIMLLIGFSALLRGGEDADFGFIGIMLLPIGVIHWYAAKGARDGKSYGKVLSRIFGTLWLLGFPIGTAFGIYVLAQTGAKWKASTEATTNEISCTTPAPTSEGDRTTYRFMYKVGRYLSQLNGWKRMFVACSIFLLLAVVIMGVGVYKHEKYSVLVAGNISPAIFKLSKMNWLEKHMAVMDGAINVGLVAHNPKTGEQLALVNNEWIPLIKREDTGWLIIKIISTSAIFWFFSIFCVYLVAMLIAWIINGFKLKDIR